MQSQRRVSIIIPTTCETKRRVSLLRAIDSLTTDAAEQPVVIVVVNGERFDADLLASLRGDCRLHVIYEPIGSVSRAQLIGRRAVQTDYFGFLDDDDEYLPGTIAQRRAHLDVHPEADGVVCNGWRFDGEQEQPYVMGFERIRSNPPLALAETNWLASCAALLRTQRVGSEFFDERFRFIEWTLLGFKLALTRRLEFIDVPGYRVNSTAQSASKSSAYVLAHVDVLKEVLKLPLPLEVRVAVRHKLGAAHHMISDFYRGAGRRAKAWQHHLASLVYPGGLGYLSYTRRLLWIGQTAAAS